MVLYAFKNGVTTLDDVTMNAIIASQPSSLIFDGSLFDSKTGSGVYENNLSTASFITRFTATGQTTIGRVELELTKYGTGADVKVEIRSGFVSDGTNDGTLLKSVTFPAKIFSSGFISLPIDLSGLTAGTLYWLRVNKAGDASNHIRWVGEPSTDANYPAYSRSGTSGAWATAYALHFKAYANTPGTYQLKHGIYGINGKTLLEYNADQTIAHVWRWLPSSDGSWQIAEKLVPTYDGNKMATRWEVQ